MNAIVLCHKLKFPSDASLSVSLRLVRAQPRLCFCGSGTAAGRKCKMIYAKLRCGASEVAYLCRLCHKIFSSINAARIHARNHTDAPFSCDSCCQKFVCKSRYNYHTKYGHTFFQCEKCDMKFDKASLHRFVKHKALQHVKCSICEKGFSTSLKLKNHINVQHPDTLVPFKCDRCEKCFRSQYRLDRHKREHVFEDVKEMFQFNQFRYFNQEDKHCTLRKFRCCFCNQLCIGVKHLAAHYRSHKVSPNVDGFNQEQEREEEQETEEKDIGGGSEVTTGYLSMSEKQKLFVCYVCDRYFDKRKELKRHLKNLHSEGAAVCNICEFKFSTSDELKNHKKLTHLYKCKLCSLTFIRKSHRKEHKLSHN